MSIEDLLRTAFQEGCGEPLPAPSLSVQHAAGKTLTYWTLTEILADRSGWGKSLLPTEASPKARFRQEAQWIAQLGKALVRQSRAFVPTAFLEAAVQWPELSPSAQRRLARQYFQWIAKRYVGEVRRLTMEEMREEARKPYDERRIFPRHWDTEGVTPNCLGMLLLLTFFAQHTGARFRTVNVLQMNGTVFSSVTGALYGRVKEDLETRYIVWNEDLLDMMQERVERGKRPGLGTINFHHALALQLADGSWYYLDPNAHTCGQVPGQWRLSEIDPTLQALQPTFPGITLSTGHSNGYDHFLKRWQKQMEEAVAWSHQLEEPLTEMLSAWFSPWQPIDLGEELDTFARYQKMVMAHPAWAFLDSIHPANSPPLPPAQSLSLAQRRDSTIRFMLATFPVGQTPTLADLEAERQRFNRKPEHREKCIRHLLSRFHFWTISRYFRAIRRTANKHLHPCVEVNGCPFHSIGLFTINSLRHAHRQVAVTQFLEHTSSQLIAREVMRNPHVSPGVSERIATHLCGLPIRHPLVEHTLQEYRKEQENVGAITEGVRDPD